MTNMPEVHAAILKPPCSTTVISGEGAMMHWHNFPQIWYVLRGELLHTVGEETCRVKAGSCIFIPAFYPHGTSEATSDSEVVSVSFSEAMFANAQDDIFLLGNAPYVCGRCIRLFSHFEGAAKKEADELISAISAECSKSKGRSNARLSTLLLRLIKKLSSDAVAKKLTKTERRRMGEIADVVSYVAEDISMKVTIDELCAALDMSQAAFMRNFKKVTGMTFARMLISMRVRYACMQLVRTDKKMVAITGETGFYDEAHFAHSFSEYTGKTPSQYRLENSTVFDDICIVCEDGEKEIYLTSKRKPRRKKTPIKNS